MMPGGGNHPSQMHPYGQYGGNVYNGYNGTSNGAQSHYMGNSGRDMGMGHNNGYNSNAHHPYGNNYMHRGSGGPNHGIGNTYTRTPTYYTNPTDKLDKSVTTCQNVNNDIDFTRITTHPRKRKRKLARHLL